MNRITVQINGTIVAPSDHGRALRNLKNWILFRKVDNLNIHGGRLDAKVTRESGQIYCQVGARVSS